MAYKQSYSLSPSPDTILVLSLEHQHLSTTICKGNDLVIMTI